MPAADLSNHADAPNALLPLNFETDPITSSFKSSTFQHQSFENIDSLDYSQFDFPQLYGPLSTEAFPNDPFCFSYQATDLESNALDSEDGGLFRLSESSNQLQ